MALIKLLHRLHEKFMNRTCPYIRLALALTLVVATLSFTGCIRRTAIISSDPPAAKVWINGVYRGQTPVEVPYNWNWFYDVRVEKAGYETKTARECFGPAPQHILPLDLAAEVAPFRSHENQWRHYVLTPKQEL